MMKKFLNSPEAFVDEMLQGILSAHPHQLKNVANDLRCIVRADAPSPERLVFRPVVNQVTCRFF